MNEKDIKYWKKSYDEMFERACEYKNEITDLKEDIEDLEKSESIWWIIRNCVLLAFICLFCSWLLCMLFEMITDVIMWFQFVRWC